MVEPVLDRGLDRASLVYKMTERLYSKYDAQAEVAQNPRADERL
jgi:hypothetical protein